MRQTYTAEVKARVIAEWKAGATSWQLHKSYAIPRPTIQSWTVRERRLAVTLQPQKTYDLNEMGLRLLDGSANAGANILELTNDKDWLRKQGAGELAVLYGVIFDKLARLAEGASRQTAETQLAAGVSEDS